MSDMLPGTSLHHGASDVVIHDADGVVVAEVGKYPEAQKNPEAVESDSWLDFGRGVAECVGFDPEFPGLHGPVALNASPMVVMHGLAGARGDWMRERWMRACQLDTLEPLRETTIHRMARAVLEREEETLP